ncbi:hypothetical protein C1646_697901 [Rhizophagus diaphanus]|nr:hypothetical protein C1646_697901 [Rhizophagus diaphanus] [Rhizophagus sp. MUCL 43196]
MIDIVVYRLPLKSRSIYVQYLFIIQNNNLKSHWIYYIYRTQLRTPNFNLNKISENYIICLINEQ